MTKWRPSQNRDHLVDYESKTVIKGRKSFNQLVDEEIDNDITISNPEKTRLKQQHRDRKPTKR